MSVPLALVSPGGGSPVQAQVLGWLAQTWGIGGWFRTLFSQPLEVHAFMLGAFVGGILATVSVSGRPQTALAATLAVLLFTFGAFETVLCGEGFAACRHIRFKPWYFLCGVFLVQSLAVGVYRRTAGERGEAETELAVTPLSGVLVAIVLLLGAASLVVGRPAHPITGLATVGGLAGSVLGSAAYEWSRPESTVDGYLTAVRQVIDRDLESSTLLVTAGIVFGFGYPRLFWELGRLLGSGGFPLGPITLLRYSVGSVALYVTPALAAAVTAIWLSHRSRGERLGGGPVAAIVFGFAAYAICLVLATGLAATVWFRFVPIA